MVLPEVRTGHCQVSHAALTQGQSPTSVPRSCTEHIKLFYGEHSFNNFICLIKITQTENQTHITYGSKVTRRSLSPFSCSFYSQSKENLHPLWLSSFGFDDHLIWADTTACMCAKTLQSCLTLCNPMDRSLPGSFASGILQARILEWVAMPSSEGSS